MKTLLALFVTLFITAQPQTPQQAADDLLAADRAFSAASAKTDLITGISAMFASDVAMTAPTGLVFGSQKAIETLRVNPANAGARAEWTPARVAVSADGKHGFTAGFMTVTRADGVSGPAKYLAYWEKQSAGWRVLAYKRQVAKTLPAAAAPTYLLPMQNVMPADTATLEHHRETLADAERSFASEAQTIGLGEAFRKYGSPDAINLGGPDVQTFVFGNDAIANQVGQGLPPNTSPVNWGPDKTIIAASGDFGVTIGYITRSQPGPDPSTGSASDGKTPPAVPFFTIWRRDSLSAPWRYIAE